MKILFMGTPEFAVPTLKALNESEHSVVGVFTQPDKAVGRKQIITPPPVKVYATENGLKVFQPTSLKTDETFNIIEELEPDIIVVVAYGKILPKRILDYPKYKCVNGHASLLPRHRGASPIQCSIICGDEITGVTTMLMGEGLDTGDMLLSSATNIDNNETAEELHDRLSVICSNLMLETIKGLEEGKIAPIKQDDNLTNYAPIINKEMGLIDFSKSAKDIHNLVRGFYPWPSAYFFIEGKRIKVLKAEISENSNKPFGTIIDSTNELIIACGNNTSIKLITIQPEGSKKMSASDYLKGHSLPKDLQI